VQHEGRPHVDPQPPARRRPGARHLRLGIFDCADNIARAKIVYLSFRGQGEAASGAVQEPRSEPILQPGHELRDSRGGEPKVFAGG